MKTPLILLTYGFTQKLCTWEEDNIIYLPIFSEPSLASIFLSKFKLNLDQLLADKEELQIQVCDDVQHAIDMIKMIGLLQPLVQIKYNPTPLGEDAEQVVEKIAGQFTRAETVINRTYNLEQAIEALEDTQ
jgi:hypothetical protein